MPELSYKPTPGCDCPACSLQLTADQLEFIGELAANAYGAGWLAAGRKRSELPKSPPVVLNSVVITTMEYHWQRKRGERLPESPEVREHATKHQGGI